MATLILMYHRAHDPKRGLYWDALKRHLEDVAKNYTIVSPGENKAAFQIALTFDDAFYDFYAYVFPLLKALQIPALLAIPTGLMIESTHIASEKRLAHSGYQTLFEGSQEDTGSLCTWAECREMARSGLVHFAAHGHQHIHLKNKDSELYYQEIVGSKQILEKQLGQAINSFVYPFGSLDKTSYGMVRAHFQYAMRIGTAINHGWGPLLYRVDAENFWPQQRWWGVSERVRWQLQYYKHQLRALIRGY